MRLLLQEPFERLKNLKEAALELVEAGGVYLNNRRVSDPSTRATTADVINDRFLVRHDRNNYRLVRIGDQQQPL